MLFRVTPDNDIKKDNPGIQLIPELSGLTNKQLRYILSCYDYQSPFKNLPLEQRKIRSALTAGYKYEKDRNIPDVNMRNLISGKVESVEKGITAFMRLQFDEERDLLESYDAQLAHFKAILRKQDKSDNETKIAISIMKEYDNLLEKRKRIMEILEIRKEKDTLEQESISEKSSLLEELDLDAI